MFAENIVGIGNGRFTCNGYYRCQSQERSGVVDCCCMLTLTATRHTQQRRCGGFGLRGATTERHTKR
jgi:hypothetical protein